MLKLLSKLLLLLSQVQLARIFSVKVMRRVVLADKLSVSFHYYERGEQTKEVGNVSYNMRDGLLHVFAWPASFSSLKKVEELIRLLSFAVKIIRSELCN